MSERYAAHHERSDRSRRLRGSVLRDRRRNLLGTGPTRLRRSKTGKIACFPGQPSHGGPGARGIEKFPGKRCSPREFICSQTTGNSRRAPIHEGARAAPLTANFSGSSNNHVHRTHLRARVRGGGDRLRPRLDQLDHEEAGRQRAHAGDRGGHPGRRQGVPQSPVRHHRHRRRHPVRHHLVGARRPHCRRLPRRRGAVRARRVHRHERFGALERAHRGSGAHGPQRSARDCIPRRRDHRHARRGPGLFSASPASTGSSSAPRIGRRT